MPNEILLLKDVEKLGRKGELVRARSGYIRNFLIPQKLALVPTKAALRLQVKLQEERRQQAMLDRQAAEEAAGHLAEITVTTVVKVDPEGNMYGSVTAADIVDLLLSQASIPMEKRALQLKHPIKTTGEHVIPVKLKEGITAEVRVKVVPEGSEEV